MSNTPQSNKTPTQSDLEPNKNAVAQQSSNALPEFIDLSKWEDSGFMWSGTLTPANFKRLDNIVLQTHQDTPIAVTAELYKRNNVTWLNMSFDGDVWVTCQRCLQPLAFDVSHDASLALLYSESQQSMLDDDTEFLMLDEVTVDANEKGDAIKDHLVKDNGVKDRASNKELSNGRNSAKKVEEYLAQTQATKTINKLLPLAKLVEDELLLDVPLSPKHDNCEMLLDHVGEIIEVEEEEENPFAALAALKGKL